MNKVCQNIISDDLKSFQDVFDKVKETLLSNLVMISEIPAPTFGESHRARWLVDRFNQLELMNCSIDEAGNAFGVIPGKTGDQNILIVAHLDTLYPETIDHTITVQPGVVIGPGVGDNGLGLAALMILPLVLQELNIQLDSNIILMGSSRSLGHGDIAGIRFFLNNFKRPIKAGLCIEGVRLGRISHTSLGMLRGKLTNIIPEEYDWTRFDSSGAIVNMNEIINKLLELPLPRKPKTSIVLGSLEGGTSYNTQASRAMLRFEIRSEDDGTVDQLAETIHYLAEEMTSRTGSTVDFKEIARRKCGGTQFSHPMNIMAREILKKMDVPVRLTPSTSELSAFIDQDIPAITIGLTTGENMEDENEMIHIEPIRKGLAQFVAILKSVDMGCCDE